MIRADRVRGAEITGYEMLDARDRRAARQAEWLSGQSGCCLVSVTMNIAGAVKSTPLIRDGFSAGMELVDDTLKNLGVSVLHGEEWLKKTGCEGFRLVRGSASEVKRAMIGIEEACAFGRLMDIDVLGTDQKPLTRDEMGLPERRCLVCGAPARNCGRTQINLAVSRVKRLVELNKNVVFIVNEIRKIIKHQNFTLGYSAEEIKNNSLNNCYSILSLARKTELDNSVTVCSLLKTEEESNFINLLKNELDNMNCNFYNWIKDKLYIY